VPPDNEIRYELGIAERSAGDWRSVGSAWLVASLVVVLFAAADARASLRSPSSRETTLAGVVIPRHDPSFLGPDEIAASGWLVGSRAEALLSR